MTHTALHLTAEQVSALISDSFCGLPDEICGILGGLNSRVEAIFPVTNVSSHPGTSFYMEENQLFQTLVAIEDRGWDLLAFYHSHPPCSRTDPSDSDLLAAAYPGSLMLIVVPGDDGHSATIRAFNADAGAPAEVPIVVDGQSSGL